MTHTHSHTHKHTHKHLYRNAVKQRQTGRQAGRQADRQTDRQAGRQADRQTEVETWSMRLEVVLHVCQLLADHYRVQLSIAHQLQANDRPVSTRKKHLHLKEFRHFICMHENF